MRLAALYDIHGNVFALDAVLRDLEREQVDVVLIGGDVAYGPFVRDALDRLLALGGRAVWIRGNADRELVDFATGNSRAVPPELHAALAWEAATIPPAHVEFLARLPHRTSLHVGALGDVLFCHGSPRRDDEVLTRLTPPERLSAALRDVSQALVVCGHTHVPFDRRAEAHRVVNAGSVGLAYGEAVASWALLGDDVTLKRTTYDREEAARAIRGSGHPLAEAFEQAILAPPSAEDATAFFESRADNA